MKKKCVLDNSAPLLNPGVLRVAHGGSGAKAPPLPRARISLAGVAVSQWLMKQRWQAGCWLHQCVLRNTLVGLKHGFYEPERSVFAVDEKTHAHTRQSTHMCSRRERKEGTEGSKREMAREEGTRNTERRKEGERQEMQNMSFFIKKGVEEGRRTRIRRTIQKKIIFFNLSVFQSPTFSFLFTIPLYVCVSWFVMLQENKFGFPFPQIISIHRSEL